MTDRCRGSRELPEGLYQVVHYHIDHCGDIWVPYEVPADCCCGDCETCRACQCWPEECPCGPCWPVDCPPPAT